jgi:hypothetical protein
LFFHSVNVSDVFGALDLGAKSNTSVRARPTSHNVCVQRGGGLRAGGGCGGSFEGPDFAGLER